ncbi:hypothetical protein CAEBREN_09434 [Caenorhabditis brenneri]|uniref:Uncharacterized protein n=1 Tax=Caenorhabditis brenneri TaxID=135651 RepID=G0P0K1_CAEBE|nr:hypothetical protein CAEBREN_09434 [Caenorhabditis brenneri]
MILTYFQRPLFWMLFAESRLDINYRILALLFILAPAAFVPSIPYSITLTYALFLNWKIKPSDYFLNCKITRARITAVVVTCFAMVTALRWYPPFSGRYYATILVCANFSLSDSSLQKFHIVKWLHTILISGLLFRKFHYLLTRGKHAKLGPLDYARLVHVSLFVFIIWSTSLSCIYNEYLIYLNSPTTPRTVILAFEDSCIMQSVIIFSTYLSNVKCLRKSFERSKVYPISPE